MAFACVRCLTFHDVQRVDDGRRLCAVCRELEAAAVLERERVIHGPQPAVCGFCRQPFAASRLGTMYCSSSCRSRAWRQERTAVGT